MLALRQKNRFPLGRFSFVVGCFASAVACSEGEVPSQPDDEDHFGGASSGGAASSGDGDGGAGGVEPAPRETFETEACPAGKVGFAEEVIESDFGSGESFGQDQLEKALGGPLGGGCCSGSLDVVSLGDGGSITLGFGPREVVDGEGADFIVFENAFWAGGDEDAAFVEYGKVEVSEDGVQWFSFPCDGSTGVGCAGTMPTLANPERDEVDVFDPEDAGGDAFDLAELGLKSARYVRISDLPGDDMGFDLEAVAIVHGNCK